MQEEKFIGILKDGTQFGRWELYSQWAPAEKPLPSVIPDVKIVPVADSQKEPEQTPADVIVAAQQSETRRVFQTKDIGEALELETDGNARRQDIFNLLQQIETGDPELQKFSTTKLRKYLSLDKNPPIQDAIDCEAPRKLISLLQVTTEHVLQVFFALFNSFLV